VPTSLSSRLLTSDIQRSACAALEAVRQVDHKISFYSESSSGVWQGAGDVRRRKRHRYGPRGPYGVAKVLWPWITVNYREKLTANYACTGFSLTTMPLRRKGIRDSKSVRTPLPA